MRFGIALDLHAAASAASEVGWSNVRSQALHAEALGFDLAVLPDHLAYRAGGEGDYVLDDEAVGVRESVTIAGALAAATDRIVIGHSVINAPYRTPAMLAHVAVTLADVSGGRYSLGLGVGNSFDYDQLGVEADRRVERFEEYVEIVSELLRTGRSDRHGRHWSAAEAELALRTDDGRPTLVVAAGGPRTMRLAARFGDGWNGFAPTDPSDSTAADLVALLESTCADVDRDPGDVERTIDVVTDPLDLRGARGRSVETLGVLGGLGIDEVRCYTLCEPTNAARVEAMDALAVMIDDSGLRTTSA